MGRIQIIALALGGLCLGGCAWLPAAGPSTRSIVSNAGKNGVRSYALVNVNNAVVDILAQQKPSAFQSLFGGDRMPPAPTISVGDTVSVSVWEAGDGALFSSPAPALGALGSGSRNTTIPDQTVMPDGYISVPFAGRVAVVGQTMEQLQERIRKKLKGMAIDPQVIVAVSRSPANTVTVTGEVVSGARVPLSPKGDRILDMIASAGGIRTPTYETAVRLTRGNITATIPVVALLAVPQENIYVWPGDILTVIQQPQYFVSLGATGRNAEIPFGAETVNLSQALGKAAGLLDERADLSGVFVLRYEPRALVVSLGARAETGTDAFLPVVYRFDFKNLNSYFLGQRFLIKNRDVIYIANADANGIQKVLQLLGAITNPIVTGVVVNNSIQ